LATLVKQGLRVLIIGGSGLIGGRLGEYLQSTGCKVFLGTRDRVSWSWGWSPGLTLVDINWNKNNILEDVDSDIDVIVHAAGVNAQNSELDPEYALRINGLGTSRLLNSAIRLGVPRLVYISTAQVYGSSMVGEVAEDSSVNNLHPYATSHLAGEHAVRFSRKEKLIDGVVIRLANGYGAPVHRDVDCWRLLVNDLCRQAVTTNKIVLRSSGKQQRSFISLSNVCYVLGKLIEVKQYELTSDIFNVGSKKSLKVLDMAHLVQKRCIELLGTDIELVTQPSKELEDPFSFNITKLEDIEIKFQDNHTTEIDQTLRFCMKNYC